MQEMWTGEIPTELSKEQKLYNKNPPGSDATKHTGREGPGG